MQASGRLLVMLLLYQGAVCIASNTTDLDTSDGSLATSTEASVGGAGHGNSSLTGPNHTSERYHIFSFDFEVIRSPYVVSLWILIASIAKLGFHLNHKLPATFPESCLLIVLGIVVGMIVYFALKSEAQEITISASTFFQFLLPPIILDAGYFMPNRAFFNNIGTILLFAVVGTLWNTGTIGVALWGISEASWLSREINLLHCLVFSSLISAVDPVAVLAVFEEIHVNEQLHIVVFGESLLNDAVTVVLYKMFSAYAGQEDGVFIVDVFSGIVQFFVVGLGGVLIGVIFGLLCSFITKYTAHVRVIEPMFVFLLAYLSYLTSEMFHLSGIMALTFCGIVMKQYVIFNISEKSQTTIKYFLKMLSSMTETVIFMMLGMQTIKDNHVWDVVFIAATIIACLIFRALGVLLLTWFANKQRMSKLTFVDQFVMSYGGLRGAIAFALAILLEEKTFPEKNLFVTTTILVVMFTVFVQGITIKPLVNALNVAKQEKMDSSMCQEINERLFDHTMAAVEDITGYHGNHWLRDKWEYYDNNYLKPYLLREKPMTAEHGIMRTLSKLSLRDAVAAMHGGGPKITKKPIQDEQSLLRIINSWSVVSLSDRGSNLGGSDTDLKNETVVDMKALESNYSKKFADDTVTHHLLKENLLRPRQRMWTKHKKHSLGEEDLDRQAFHHNIQLNLRNVISKHQHHKQEKRKKATQKRPKLNFAFDSAEPDINGQRGAAGKNDSDEEEGITFAVPQQAGNGVTKRKAAPVSAVTPTAVESQLPWKRSGGHEGVEGMPSQSAHLMPDDSKPVLCEVPSWANNMQYAEDGA